jgi:hypothetical protein
MLFTSKRWPGEMHVARALITEELDREPSAHVYYETHVPWLEINDALPKKASVNSGAQASSPGSGD